jgi:ketosteroid isomerase-like protein
MTTARFPRRYSRAPKKGVLVFAQESGRGKDSGIEVRSRRITGVYELRDGKIVRFKAYLDRDEALQAAGLRE